MVNYHVFLSFRGPDTRESVVQYLYDRLIRLGIGIRPFLDSREIQNGEPISTTIVDAINHSDICVPVFSEDFASSAACLMEVAQMVKSKKEILPIFFFVEPCDVRHQRGTYKKSFDEHERKNHYSELTINEWRDALKTVADRRGPIFQKPAVEAAPEVIGGTHGPELHKTALEADLGETSVIEGLELKEDAVNENRGAKGQFHKDLFSGFQKLENLIFDIWKSTRMDEQHLTTNLVGRDEDLQEMMRKLGFGSKEDGQVVEKLKISGRRVLVVWGLTGVGKTALTKVLFHRIRHFFDGHSFLENYGSELLQWNGVVSLQQQLIRQLTSTVCPEVKSTTDGTTIIRHYFKSEKVLMVLDDVKDFKQIIPLAEELTWFGPGSTIILTTKREDVTKSFYKGWCPEKNEVVFYDHNVSHLKENHALELFNKHAFRNGFDSGDFKQWSREITSAVGGLPFAIEKVGTYLYHKDQNVWRETCNRLKSRLEETVESELKIYYDCLNANAKRIFLDIACFFTGIEKRIPSYMWAAHKWDPSSSIGDLQNMSFIKIGEENEFWMDNQLKLLGRSIVEQEDEDPRQRTRLWNYKDYKGVRKKFHAKRNTSKVEALRVTSDFNRVKDEVFCDLANLKFLELDKVHIIGNHQNLLPNLAWLDWRECPNKSKLFAFEMKKLVILSLCSSPFRLTLEEWAQLMKKAHKLEVLNLKGCTWTKASLEIPVARRLKCLILEGCLYLKLSETISKFENLVSLNIKDCKSVKRLPQALWSMKVLKELFIDGTEIGKLHFMKDSLPKLEILSACECTKLLEVTDTIRYLKNIRKLYLRSCDMLETLPCVFGDLVKLQEMDLSDTLIDELPPCVQHCKELQVLKMARTFLKRFPQAIKDLKELRELDFTLCRGLRGQCCDITGLFSLRILRLESTEISEVLARDEGQFCLHRLELDFGVTKLKSRRQTETDSQRKRKRQTHTSNQTQTDSQLIRERQTHTPNCFKDAGSST